MSSFRWVCVNLPLDDNEEQATFTVTISRATSVEDHLFVYNTLIVKDTPDD